MHFAPVISLQSQPPQPLEPELRLPSAERNNNPRCSPSGAKAMRVNPDCSAPAAGRICVHQPRRRPNGRHATPLPARSTLTAGPCSNSLHPTVGRSFSRAKGGMASTAASICAPDRSTLRLHRHRCPRRLNNPHLERSAPGANASSFNQRKPLECCLTHDPRALLGGFCFVPVWLQR